METCNKLEIKFLIDMPLQIFAFNFCCLQQKNLNDFPPSNSIEEWKWPKIIKNNLFFL